MQRSGFLNSTNEDAGKIFTTALEEMISWLQKTTTKDIGTAITNLVLEYRQGDSNTEKEQNIHNEEILQAMN